MSLPALSVALIVLVMSPLPLFAEPTATERSEVMQEPAKLILVLDASGSMDEPTPDGSRRIEAAREAMRTLADGLGPAAQVGVRVFGATVFDSAEPGACDDTQNVVPVGPLDLDAIDAAASGYEPLGQTPIGSALLGAAEDLGDTGERTIVLVSDGEPNCEPEPCAVAEQITEDGIEIRIDVIGLDVAGTARERLQCIAAAGGGTYYDAANAQQLADSVKSLGTRATRPFGFGGIAVKGSADRTSAPLIATGRYIDELPALDQRIHYRVARESASSTMHIGFTTTGDSAQASLSVRGQLEARQLDATNPMERVVCGVGQAIEVSDGAHKRLTLGGLDSARDNHNAQSCLVADEYYLSAELTSGDIAGRQFEIVSYEEPPSDLERVEFTPPTPAWRPIEHDAQPSRVVPGDSFGSAPVLEDDGPFGLDINSGETQVFAVPVDWGQTLQAQIDVGSATVAAALADDSSSFDLRIVSPTRRNVSERFAGTEPEDWHAGRLSDFAATGQRTLRTGVSMYAVDPRNRFAELPIAQAAGLPGIYYVEVTLRLAEDLTQPYVLSIKRFDDPTVRAPSYEDIEGLMVPSRMLDLTNVDTAPVVPASDGDELGVAARDAQLSSAITISAIAFGAAALSGLIVATIFGSRIKNRWNDRRYRR